MYQILRGGCNTRHPSTFFTDRPQGNNNYVLLIIRTPSHFILNGKENAITPGTAIIIAPHVPYFYQNPNGEYIDDWLHFDMNTDINPFDSTLQCNEFFHVEDMEFYSTYIRQLLWEQTYSDPQYNQENIDHIMQVLLNHLKSAFQKKNLIKHYNPYFTSLQEIRIAMQSAVTHPLSADECAQNLGISKSRFQHLYSELFGIPFGKDYILIRIATAKDLIETSSLPMQTIAEFCGYASEVHFYRQFKAYTQITPAEYRRRYRNNMFLTGSCDKDNWRL